MPRLNDATVPELVAQVGGLTRAVLIREIEALRAGAEAAVGRVLVGLVCLAVAAGLTVLVVGSLGAAAGLALVAEGMDPVMAALSVAGGFALFVLILTLSGLRAFRGAREFPARHLDRLRVEAARLKETL